MHRILSPFRQLPGALSAAFAVTFCFFSSWACATGYTMPQQRAITGRVTSADDGNGFPGVNILVKGTSIGTVTDSEGRYSIEVPSAESVLVFSSIGYATTEIAVGSQSVVNVDMQPDVTSLNEVVVVGYGAVKKTDVTGALASVSAAQLQAVPVQSVSQALQGRAAGVDVAMGSFRPGENPTVRIRGNRSLKASNNPLYVVDGIPLSEGSGVNDFNPADIQSIEVLKDASATAIYGSRGANGVILVTTKKGKSGPARITYDGYVGISEPLTTIDMLSGPQYAELKREANRNNSTRSYGVPYADPAEDYDLFKQDPYLWQSVAMGYDWVDEANRIPVMRDITDEEREIYRKYYEQDLITYANNAKVLAGLVHPDNITQVPSYHADRVRTTDWADHVLRTGIKQSHQIGVSGGTDNLTVKLSLGYYNELGVQKNQGFKRYNVALALDYKASNFIRFGGTANFSLAEQDFGGGTDLYTRAIGQLPLAVPYDNEGRLIRQPGADALIFNPIFDIDNALDDRRINRIFGSYYAELNLAKGLRYRINFGPDFRHNRRGRFYSSLTTERNQGTSQAFYDQDQRFSYVMENLLFYDKAWAEKHTLSATVLQSIQEDRYEASTIQVSDLPYDNQQFYNVGSSNSSSPDAYTSALELKRLMSYMGRLNYTFMNKYLVTVTGRFDGASMLAEGNKWDFFPSFALAWKLQEEAFLSDAGFIDELKLRVGYGKTGNSAVIPYSTLGSLLKSRYVWGNSAAWGYRPDQLPNPDLKWENTAQVNAGIDFSFMNSRLSGTIDAYIANTTDLIMDRQLPTASGYGVVQENIGATRNKGIELSLSTINVDHGSGFKWTTDFMFSVNREEIVELYGGTTDDKGNRWFIGHPLTVFYDYKPIGVWQSNEVEEAKRYKKIPGQPKFLDKDQDGDIDADDRMIVGSTVPDWTGSMVNSFSYKGFELSVFLYARYGQMIASGYYRPALAGRYTEMQLNYWTPANPTNDFPRPKQDQERLSEFPESHLYTDGSFAKLRQITLSYTFPQASISKYRMNSLNVYATAYNPFLWTDFKAGDPEFATPAVNATTGARLPVNDMLVSSNLSDRSIVFGVRVGF